MDKGLPAFVPHNLIYIVKREINLAGKKSQNSFQVTSIFTVHKKCNLGDVKAPVKGRQLEAGSNKNVGIKVNQMQGREDHYSTREPERSLNEDIAWSFGPRVYFSYADKAFIFCELWCSKRKLFQSTDAVPMLVLQNLYECDEH